MGASGAEVAGKLGLAFPLVLGTIKVPGVGTTKGVIITTGDLDIPEASDDAGRALSDEDCDLDIPEAADNAGRAVSDEDRLAGLLLRVFRMNSLASATLLVTSAMLATLLVTRAILSWLEASVCLALINFSDGDSAADKKGGVAVMSVGKDKGMLGEVDVTTSVTIGAELEFFTPDNISITESSLLAGGIVTK